MPGTPCEYRNIELGRSQPRVSNLRAIAVALGVSVKRLIEPVQVLRAVRFRSSKRMRSRKQILVDTGRWLSDYNDLERILEDRIECRLDDILEQLGPDEDQCDAAAALAREFFGLDHEEPVHDICGLLESRGVKVGEQKLASGGFFGLSVAAAGGGPAVVVNTWDRIPVERWIFTAFRLRTCFPA